MQLIDYYGDLTGLGFFLVVFGGVMALLNLWALIVVIVAGHRYLGRTRGDEPRNQLEHYERTVERRRQVAE